jgi:hypothetical protein
VDSQRPHYAREQAEKYSQTCGDLGYCFSAGGFVFAVLRVHSG